MTAPSAAAGTISFPMSGPMEQLQAKLDRADELIPVIRDAISDYYAAEPYVCRTDHLPDEHRIELVVVEVKPPPLRLGVLLGEFIHNLRCSLDHLVWQLALTCTDEPSRDLMFPIYETTPEDWSRIVRKRLGDVPDEAVERIWAAQPCNGENPEINALRIVQKLSNEDKHRVIPDSVSLPSEPDESHFTTDSKDVAAVHIDAPWGVELEPGMKALTVSYTPSGPHPEVHVASRLPAQVIFGSIRFRAAAMPPTHQSIARLVGSFESFFA